MVFGQQSGPPAPANQVRELLALLQRAGHTDFRDGRGPMGFTQRQAAGKFTRDEAAVFIERLEAAEEAEAPEEAEAAGPDADHVDRHRPVPARRDRPDPRSSVTDRSLRGSASEVLAAELRRRGWTVTEP
jgi:hypothetical protein